MTTTALSPIEFLRLPPVTRADLDELLARRGGEPEWLRGFRAAAWEAYESQAMPDPKDDEWRRTELSTIDLGALRPAGRYQGELPSHLHWAGKGDFAGQVAQIDGASDAVWLDEQLRAQGVAFFDLDSATSQQDLEGLLYASVYTDWKLVSLNSALWQGGCFLYVPEGVEVALPLHFWQAIATGGVSVFPRTLIRLGANSRARFVHEVASEEDAEALVSGAVEVYLGANARLEYYSINRWGHRVNYFNTIRATLEHGAEATIVNAGLGGDLSKTKTDVLLRGEGSAANLLDVSLGDGRQRFDYVTLQDHLAPRTTSDLLYKAALTGRASEVWYGTVRIHSGATGSDANQTSRNLLLSSTAKAAPIPVLEIEQFDILRCSHGATAGPVDEEQLFYLESRGIEHDEAERMLVDAFFQEVLDRIPDESLRERVQGALAAKLEASN